MSEKEIVIPEVIKTEDGKTLPSIREIDKEYKERIQSLKIDKGWIRYLIAGGVVFGVLFAASLVAAHIITGALALGLAAGVGFLGFYGYRAVKAYDPVIRKKMLNHQLTLLIKEAQEKKIETLMAYVKYLDKYLQDARKLRNKTEGVLEQYKRDLEKAKDEGKSDKYLEEMNHMIENLERNKESIDRIIEKALKNKKEFEETLEIARKKVEYVENTKDIVEFLQDSNKLDKMLVDESLNKLEQEFSEISVSIKNIAKDVERE